MDDEVKALRPPARRSPAGVLEFETALQDPSTGQAVSLFHDSFMHYLQIFTGAMASFPETPVDAVVLEPLSAMSSTCGARRPCCLPAGVPASLPTFPCVRASVRAGLPDFPGAAIMTTAVCLLTGRLASGPGVLARTASLWCSCFVRNTMGALHCHGGRCVQQRRRVAHHQQRRSLHLPLRRGCHQLVNKQPGVVARWYQWYHGTSRAIAICHTVHFYHHSPVASPSVSTLRCVLRPCPRSNYTSQRCRRRRALVQRTRP
jgi:hypothetical protein